MSFLRDLKPLTEEENSHIQEHGNFVHQRFGLFIFLTTLGVSLAFALGLFLQEFIWRRYKVNLCAIWYTRRDDEQIDRDRALAQELQRQLNEQEFEAEKIAKRNERRSWYEIYLRPFTMVATKEDFFYAREMDSDRQTHKQKQGRQRQMSNISSDDDEGEEEEDLELGQGKDLMEPVFCDQGDHDAHLYLRLPVQDTCGKKKYVDAHCAICVSEYEEGDKVVWSGLECKHAFHDECILPWLSKGKKRCPICRHWFVPGTRIDEQKKEFEERLRRMSEDTDNSTATPSTEREDPSDFSVSADLEVSIALSGESEDPGIQSIEELGGVQTSQNSDETSADHAPEVEPSSRNGGITDERISPNHRPCSNHQEVQAL